MLIPITSVHIITGDPCDENYCPIALAIDEKLSGGDWCRVLESEVQIFGSHGFMKRRFTLPVRVSRRIRNYDRGFGMEPFKFRVNKEIADELFK